MGEEDCKRLRLFSNVYKEKLVCCAALWSRFRPVTVTIHLHFILNVRGKAAVVVHLRIACRFSDHTCNYANKFSYTYKSENHEKA